MRALRSSVVKATVAEHVESGGDKKYLEGSIEDLERQAADLQREEAENDSALERLEQRLQDETANKAELEAEREKLKERQEEIKAEVAKIEMTRQTKAALDRLGLQASETDASTGSTWACSSPRGATTVPE